MVIIKKEWHIGLLVLVLSFFNRLSLCLGDIFASDDDFHKWVIFYFTFLISRVVGCIRTNILSNLNQFQQNQKVVL